MRKRLNLAAWAPIISAPSQTKARAKARELFPGASIGKPVPLCPTGHHSTEAVRYSLRKLAEHGWR